MNRRIVLHLSAVVLLVTTTAMECDATPVLSLVSTPTDLSAVPIGGTISVEVNLSGLTAGDELEFLAATIMFADSVLGTPTPLTPGPIIPDVVGFASATLPGIADGTFDTLFTTSGTDTIDANGTFYSFDVTVAGPGTTVIDFSFVDGQLVADPPGGTAVDTSGGLAVTAIPEPGPMWMWCVMGALGLVCRRLRRNP